MNFFIRQLNIFFLIPVVVLNVVFAADTQSTPAPVGSASSMQWARAEIRKIDPENSKITLRHEALTQLSMGAMTMVFRVDDKALLKPGWLGAAPIMGSMSMVQGREPIQAC